MSVHLRRQRDGSLRAEWYGEYTDRGRRKVVNLRIAWRGTPPGALLHPGAGDDAPASADFDASRKEAEGKLASFAEDARRKGQAGHLTERLIEEKTGHAVEHVRIDELADRWLTMPRGGELTKAHTAGIRAACKRFRVFMAKRKPDAAFLYEVTTADAGAFIERLRKGDGKKQTPFSPKTIAGNTGLLRGAFRRFLPAGVANPFAAIVTKAKGNSGADMVHRKPFTPEELRALLDAAQDDDFMRPLITAAALTGMRRADVCGLKWRDVDLAAGMVATKASKTGEPVEVPIFPALRAVLEERKGNGSPFVFPQAAAMLKENPDGLTWRFKKVVARAFGDTPDTPALPAHTPAADIEDEGAAAILANLAEGPRRDRTLDTFRRYCAGESVRAIHKATGRPKPTISYDLHTVQALIGKPFMRSGQAPGIKERIAAATRTRREKGKGQRAASVRDWHTLRATWVTLALSAGVPMELVRRVTGHATVDVVLRHYFKPGREQFRAALAAALPAVLTGGAPVKVKPAEELAALAGKLAAGTATKEEKKRLRVLAAKV